MISKADLATPGSTHADVVEQPSWLLRSKLRPPVIPGYYTPRPRFDDLLGRVSAFPLTLVVAPAGSGKTQLLAHWVSTAPVPTAWLSLEEMDNDPIELWTGIIATLEVLAPKCGLTVRDLLAGSAPIDDVVRALLHNLEADPAGQSVLVIDDVHCVSSSTASNALAVFVQHLPPWLHVVMAGRSDPTFRSTGCGCEGN